MNNYLIWIVFFYLDRLILHILFPPNIYSSVQKQDSVEDEKETKTVSRNSHAIMYILIY